MRHGDTALEKSMRRLFDQEFIEALIDLGRADAEHWLNAPPGADEPWQLGPLDVFVEAGGPDAASPSRPPR